MIRTKQVPKSAEDTPPKRCALIAIIPKFGRNAMKIMAAIVTRKDVKTMNEENGENTAFNVGRLFVLLTQQDEHTNNNIEEMKSILGKIPDPEADAGDMKNFSRGYTCQRKKKKDSNR